MSRLFVLVSAMAAISYAGPQYTLAPDAYTVNVRDFGARGDGATDDTAAIRKAFAAMHNAWEVVYFPRGTYLVSDEIRWKRFTIVWGQVEVSYLMNGFIDHFVMTSFRGNWDEFFGVYKEGGFPPVRLSSIPRPAETIAFGEKRADSEGDAYMDIWPPQYGSDHLTEVAHGKHRSGDGERNGGSNYAFADGGVRFLRYGAAFSPKNLWAVTDQFRNAPLPEL